MKKDLKVSLVIPAHNAEKVIEKSIKEYVKFLSACKEYEMIIVCNACKDNTAEVARKAARGNPHIRVIETKERGKGFAIINGFRESHKSIVGFMDADNAFKLGSVKEMLLLLEEYDCIIASKWLGRNFSEISEPLTRKVLAIGWRALSMILLGLTFKDTQAGCKFLKKSAFEKIDDGFICTGFDFDVELLYKLKNAGCSIKEVNIPVSKYFAFSTFRLKFLPLMFWHMFKLWAHDIYRK